MTVIKTMTVPIKWDNNNKKKVYYYGDKDDYNKAIWFDDDGKAYELIHARLVNKYSLNPYPHYNK